MSQTCFPESVVRRYQLPFKEDGEEKAEQSLIPVEVIEKRILLIRGHKVMLDSDLAELYQVPTKSLNLAVKRNAARFPEDFMFRVTKEEVGLRFQIETSKTRGGRRYLPYAFTEQGVAMLSSVLNSTRAIQVNIAIMRAFVQLRQIPGTHKGIAEKLQAMERKYDKRFKVVFEILYRLMAPPPDGPKRPIGFVSGGRKRLNSRFRMVLEEGVEPS